MAAEFFNSAAQRRVEYWTLGLGAAAALVAAVFWGWLGSSGIALGAALAWLNYRWLQQGVESLGTAARAQLGVPRVRIPKRIYAKFLGRYALLGLGLYVIVTRFYWLLLPFLCGLFAVVAAIIVEMIYEMARGRREAAPR